MKSNVQTSAGRVMINTDQLEHLRAELKKNANARVQIGIMGENASRSNVDQSEQGITNPELGLIHEFGVVGGLVKHSSRAKDRKSRASWDQFKNVVSIPERSFLRMPLIRELPDAIYKIGKDVWRKAIIEKGLITALKRLGILGEAVVQDAFDTGGFGQWAPLKPRTIKKKGSAAILIDTAQLRQGVTSRVVQ